MTSPRRRPQSSVGAPQIHISPVGTARMLGFFPVGCPLASAMSNSASSCPSAFERGQDRPKKPMVKLSPMRTKRRR